MILDQALYDAFNTTKDGKFKPDAFGKVPLPSEYKPTDEEKNTIAMIIDSFRSSDTLLKQPRREFNDMSVLTRASYDQMSFNIYQENNGQPFDRDSSDAWKSHAMRPIVRNKVISIAAHVTARMLFPKVFAYNEQSESQEDAANVMRDLIEWVSDKVDYQQMTMYAVINALVNPISVMHFEYSESFRTVKTEKDKDGKWKTKKIKDKDFCGFKLTPVSVNELFVGDFYTENIQKQPYLIWRRVLTYSTIKAKYSTHRNFKHIKPGVQTLFNDANNAFYDVYDNNLEGSMCEELIFYNKAMDLQIVLVNGVLVTECDEPNPRLDKNYPFIAFGYENFDEGMAFYKKSLAFKLQPDADIINTLYPLIIDGTYLSVMPPLIIAGEEAIASDVVIPGMTTTLMNPGASVVPLRVGQDIKAGMEMLNQVEQSINQSSESNITDQPNTANETAYTTSVRVQQAKLLLGPFVQMIASYVRQYGKLLMSDILQYMTIAEVNDIIDNGELIYQTFIVADRQVEGGVKSRKITFDANLPEDASDNKELKMSYDILEEQGGEDTNEELYKVNPVLFSKLDFRITCSPDVVTPPSDDMERALGLELYDRAINNPLADQEQVIKDFLFGIYPKSKENTSKYIKKQEPITPEQMMNAGNPQMPLDSTANLNLGQNPNQGSPLTSSGKISPMAAMKNNPLSTKVGVK